MSDPFVHLHVASGYSLRHGASSPALLVDRAADHGMDTLALTDRDGVYGAVKFVTACMQRSIRSILGTDLAVRPYDDQPVVTSTRRKTPARGGSFVDARLPRVTVLARDKAGWASVCRLVSATHLAGERRGGRAPSGGGAGGAGDDARARRRTRPGPRRAARSRLRGRPGSGCP